MSNDTHNWLTAADAAQVLKVSQRQVHYYASDGKITTRRQGRRVLFSAADVAALADELAVDFRPPPAPPRDLAPVTDLVNVLRQREQRDEERHREFTERLQRLEDRPLPPPPEPTGRLLRIVIILLVLVLVVAIIAALGVWFPSS